MGDFKVKTDVPTYGFKVKLSHEYPEKRSPYFRPSFRIIWDLLPLFLRYICYYIVCKIKGKSVVMDYLIMQKAKRMYGVPIGGIGSGTIGRGYKGEFCRFQLRPDACEYNTVDANQFIVTIKDQNDATIFQSCLSTYTKTSLSAWETLIDGNKCHYTGLYPRAWTSFDLSEFGIKLTCRQISPVIPHDYENSCMPCAVFAWSVENVGNEQRSVTISFTFKNGTGSKKADKKSSCSSKAFSYQNSEGVILYHKLDKMQCSYSLAVKSTVGVAVSKCLHFDPNSNGSVVWNQLKDNGQFDKIKDRKTNNVFGEMAVGVAAKSKLLGNTSQEFEMVLVWDMPSIIYPVNQQKYYRFYTEKFGKDDAALKIISHAMQSYRKWEDQIYEWQKPVLSDSNLPSWYKSALFNESYFLSDGGTVWLSLEEEFTKTLNSSDSRKKYGRFAYLEGHEYRMYNSYDVHFYASHALSKNFPHLQKSLQYDLRDFVFLEVPDKVKMLFNGETIERKKPNSVPHDTGDPGESPFILINAYPIHDVSTWKDLSSKFVLQTFRDATVGEVVDTQFIEDMYKACNTVMRKLLVFDYDEDGLIENSGEPDQTYDTWVMHGARYDNLNYPEVVQMMFVEKICDLYFTKRFTIEIDRLVKVFKRFKIAFIQGNKMLGHNRDICMKLNLRLGNRATLIAILVVPDPEIPFSYCGGLWLAAVYAMTEMAVATGRLEDKDFYQDILDRGIISFHEKLWNGKYYNFDCSTDQRSSIMADQLNAQWYLGCLGKGPNYPLFPKANIDSSLRTIYENNVLCFCEGTMGAVNGFLNGQVDKITIQSQEVWTGVTYALAATMIQEGMIKEGFKTAGGMFKSMTEKFGMIFDTPEALYGQSFYRAIGYMRPLSIWSIQIAWEQLNKTTVNELLT